MRDFNYAHTRARERARGLTAIQYACNRESVLLSEYLFHYVIISNINPIIRCHSYSSISRNSLVNATLDEIISSIARKRRNVKCSVNH